MPRTEGNPGQAVDQTTPYGWGDTYVIPYGLNLFSPPVSRTSFRSGSSADFGRFVVRDCSVETA
ncbi:MAG: hypothetical protein MK110_13855 [Fuerstiella sp.]|nr:hypothetical protein [Fuerstiella sp.]